ncbi:MAG: succinate dehydrogenase cytochrome b subunit [Polyangiaceae bacterium]
MSTATLTLTSTTVGKKIVMAVSGTILFGFSLVHMIGNLQMFAGADAINGYHALLYSMPLFLWGARAVLLLAVTAHIASAVALTAQNRAARDVAYRRQHHVATNYAARTMFVGGVLLGLYLVYHVGHTVLGFTAGLGYQHSATDLYANQIATYQHPWAVALNVAMALVFGSHVYHGAWSVLQSLGINHKRYNAPLRRGAMALAIVICAGFVSVPLAVYFGVVS